ncbi:hypothetical protein QU38_00970, partial [Staphylococcus aureus]
MGSEEHAVLPVSRDRPDGQALASKGLWHLPEAALEADISLGGGHAPHDLVAAVFWLRQVLGHPAQAWPLA